MVLDRIASRINLRFKKPFLRRYFITDTGTSENALFLVKPVTYMNRSGEILDQVIQRTRCGLSQLLVVCDNLDLPVGSCRLKQGGSSAGHNGLASLIQFAGSTDFSRLYVGIGRPADGKIIEHVLGTPQPPERSKLDEAVDAAASAVLSLLEQPIERVMNEVNKRRE